MFVPGEVFADRQRRVREYLREHDCRALLVSDPDHFYMLTGYHLDVAPWERPVAIVIPVEGEPFLMEVYSCEPGVYVYGVGGFRQDDTVIIGKAKPEVITKRSKRLDDQTVRV